MTDSGQVTRLLIDWRSGNERALDELTPLVYDELRQVAQARLRGENAGHTLQATALVHEVYLRLVAADIDWKDRVHFFALAATTMRRILVDHAKAKRRVKRGGGAGKRSLDDIATISAEPQEGILELDDALEQLGAIDARKARVIELIYFGGLTYDEAAEALGVSAVTIHRDLDFAKAWLHRALRADDDA